MYDRSEKYMVYNPEEYDFQGLIKALFQTAFDDFDDDILYKLHMYIARHEYDEVFKVSKDSSTKLHKLFYGHLNNGWPQFMDIYERFIKNFIAAYFFPKETSLIYQKQPTFRVHLPGNVAVGGFHCDHDYNHPLGEYNFIIPLTTSIETACTKTESEPGKRDFHFLEFKENDVIHFNGNQCIHGNVKNETGKTRVSLDFRVLLEEDYKPEQFKTSMTTATKFVVGEYYERMKLK